jgi:hypothetical protein
MPGCVKNLLYPKYFTIRKFIHLRGKNSPKNSSFYQVLIPLYGTFASPEKQGLIIDKTGLRTRNEDPISVGLSWRAGEHYFGEATAKS